LFALAMTKSIPSAVTSSGSPKSELMASTSTRRPSRAATRATSATGFRRPVVVSWWTTATWLTSGWARSAASTSAGATGVTTSQATTSAGIRWAAAMRARRSPYTPFLTTRRARSGGTAEHTTASTAAVPEPVKSTAAKSGAQPATRTSLSRQSRITSKNSGSRWQRSGVSSARRTLAVVLAGPGFRRIHSRSDGCSGMAATPS
jgi:hypothetical protein